MNLDVVWSDFAEKRLDEIFDYYKANVSLRVAKAMLRGLLIEPNRLKNDPYIGQKEELLKRRKITYRYLVFKHYKIIYSVDKKSEFIHIADVFATRLKPNKISRFE